VEPYQAYHWNTRASLLRTAAHSVDASVNLSHYDFTGDEAARRVWVFDADLTQNMPIGPYVAATSPRLIAGGQLEDGETNAVDVECGMHYQRGCSRRPDRGA
jgi:hypothetical protein